MMSSFSQSLHCVLTPLKLLLQNNSGSLTLEKSTAVCFGDLNRCCSLSGVCVDRLTNMQLIGRASYRQKRFLLSGCRSLCNTLPVCSEQGPDSACTETVPMPCCTELRQWLTTPVFKCRQEHQGYRGGSAICILHNMPLWAAWSALIQKTQDCSPNIQPCTLSPWQQILEAPVTQSVDAAALQ